MAACVSGCGVCAAWRARHAAHIPQPDVGPHGPKHVGVTVKMCFNVNFNI